MKDPKLYLHHILECIERIERYTQGNQAFFLSDEKTQDAVLRNLQVLAESTQKLPEAWKEKFPNIPWQQISGFRNRLVHEYLGIKPALVWAAIEQDLPGLKQAAEALLQANA